MTTCSLMFVDTAWAESEFKDAVIGYALAYGGITQWVAGVMEMLKGNTFAATGDADLLSRLFTHSYPSSSPLQGHDCMCPSEFRFG